MCVKGVSFKALSLHGIHKEEVFFLSSVYNFNDCQELWSLSRCTKKKTLIFREEIDNWCATLNMIISVANSNCLAQY